MRIPVSFIVAGLLATGVAGWIISGNLTDDPPPPAENTAKNKPAIGEKQPTAVRVWQSTAQPYVGYVLLTGETEASRTIDLKTQIDGRISKVGADSGATVKKGQEIVRLAAEDRPARLKEAQADIRQREVEYEVAQKLSNKGYRAETQRVLAEANLERARAKLQSIKTEIARTRISAPFGGILHDRMLELGDVVQKGTQIAHLVDLDPILVVGFVPEQDHSDLEVGQIAGARFFDGREAQGVVSYISSVADSDTRTFRIELEIANPDGEFVQGITAQMVLPLQNKMAHIVTPSLFVLDRHGRLSLKYVAAENKVALAPVDIVGGDQDRVYVTGLPDNVNLITVGHELVKDGETVTPVTDGNLVGAGASS